MRFMLSCAVLLVFTSQCKAQWSLAYSATLQAQLVKIKPTPIEADIPPVIKYLETLPDEAKTTQRFLSLQSIPTERRDNAYRITSFVVNSLTWVSHYVELRVVPETDNRVLVVDLVSMSRNESDLQRIAQTWELLALADPYYSPAWCGKEDCTKLADISHSVCPILRADFFCFYSTLGDNRKTKDVIEGFYDRFLGLPGDEESLLALLDINEKNIENKGVDRKAAITQSGSGSLEGKPVALNNRYLNRYPTTTRPSGGYYWTTQDFINSTGNRDVYFDPLTRVKDGGETIFSLPNGLQAYFLSAAETINGKTRFISVSEVPNNIATDKNFRHHTVKLSTCTACHPRGINTFKCVLANELFKPAAPGGLVFPVELKPFAIARQQQLFKQDIPSLVAADQINYCNSVSSVTGFKPEELETKFVPEYIAMISGYENPVTAIQACWEFGAKDASQLAIEDYLADKVVSTTKGELLALVKGGVLNRDTFEQDYHNGKLLQAVKENILRKNDKPKINLVVPSTVVGQAQTLVVPVDSKWRVKLADGKLFGPVDDDTFAKWMLEGRIKQDTSIMDVEKGEWQPANIVFKSYFDSLKSSLPEKQEIKNNSKDEK